MSTDPAAPRFDFDALFDVDDYLFFYEDTLAAEDTEGQCDALVDAMAMLPGMRVLDLGCGHGRHAIALARRGFDVTGVDLVPAMVDRARREAARAGVSVELRVGDMRAIDDDARYDRAVMLFDAFGFMPDGDSVEILRRVARALRPGGMLCVDVRNRDWIARALPPTTVLQRGDAYMIDRHHFDSATGRVVDHRVVVRGGAHQGHHAGVVEVAVPRRPERVAARAQELREGALAGQRGDAAQVAQQPANRRGEHVPRGARALLGDRQVARRRDARCVVGCAWCHGIASEDTVRP